MTCIIWHQNKLLVDSATVNGVEWSSDCDKVLVVEKPGTIRLHPDHEPDPIVGFTYSHARGPALAFIQNLMDRLLNHHKEYLEKGEAAAPGHKFIDTVYSAIAISNVWNDDNYFKALLIGRDFNYVFTPIELDGERFTNNYGGFARIPKDQTIVLGTSMANRAAAELMLNDPDVPGIRAMMAVINNSRSVAAPIYQYEVMPDLDRVRKVGLVRTAMWEEFEKDELTSSSAFPKLPYPPDLVYNTKSHTARLRVREAKHKPVDYKPGIQRTYLEYMAAYEKHKRSKKSPAKPMVGKPSPKTRRKGASA